MPAHGFLSPLFLTPSLPRLGRWLDNVSGCWESLQNAYRYKSALRRRRLLAHVRYRPPGALMSIGWWVRLVCKVLDVVAVGEWLTLWGQVIKPGTRPLSALEIEEARKVLGESVPYPQVRVDEHSLLAWVGALFRLIIQRRFRHLGVVIAYTVNFTRRIHPAPGNEDMAWLIHELVHVAQMEHVGLQYYPEALAAQFCSGYDYGGCQALADGRPLAFFNREQQGEIARDFYRCLYHSPQRAPYYRRQIGDLRLGHV